MDTGTISEQMDRPSLITRRHWLRRGAGALLAAGCWPGRLRAADNGRGGAFHFVVINDTHFQSPRCPAWFERVTAHVRALNPRPGFCLMVGDLVEHGTAGELGAMRDILQSLRVPFHAVIGNHDYVSDTDRSPWDRLFPGSLNHHFEHAGWRFIGLDSSEGTQWQNTTVSDATLQWLDDHAPRFDPDTPTVLFTHFPMGADVPMRPGNADDLLERLLKLNLVAVFNGHHHGFTERKSGGTTLLTNRCCAISRDNHDGSPEKGFFLCAAREGGIDRKFIEVHPPAE